MKLKAIILSDVGSVAQVALESAVSANAASEFSGLVCADLGGLPSRLLD